MEGGREKVVVSPGIELSKEARGAFAPISAQVEWSTIRSTD